MAHLEFGPRLLDRIMELLSGIAEKDKPERMEGRRLVTVIKPAKGTNINQKQENLNNKQSFSANKQQVVNIKPETEKAKLEETKRL